jgi:hypothetical protein
LYTHPIPRNKCIAYGLNNYLGNGSTAFLLAHEYRALTSGSKVPVGNGSTITGTVTLSSLTWNDFRCSIVLENQSTAFNRYAFDTRSAGNNGFVGALLSNAGGFPDKFDFLIADGSGTAAQFFAPSYSGVKKIDIDFLGTTPIIKYDGIVQTLSASGGNRTINAFTPNLNATIFDHHTGSSQMSGEGHGFKFGTTSSWTDYWPMVDTSGMTSYNVIGSNDISWSISPGWASPADYYFDYNNLYGHSVSGSVMIPALYTNQNLDAAAGSLEEKASGHILYNATNKLISLPYHSELQALGLEGSLTFAEILALDDYDDRIFLNEEESPNYFNLLAFYDNLLDQEKANIRTFLTRANVPGATDIS